MGKTVVSFLVSGKGSNFKSIAEKIQSGEINAEFGCVISNKAGVGALETAESMSIPYYVVPSKKYYTRKGHEKAIAALLEKHKSDLIVAAGYMRILSPFLVNKFPNKIINIHPALLPAFPGMHAQKQAYEYGVRYSGCTAHFVDTGTDTGPIILQRIVEVDPKDSLNDLSRKILKEEHVCLPNAVKLFCENKIRLDGRKVIVD